MKSLIKNISGWRLGSLGVIALFAACLAAQWHRLPLFLDIYYHTSCMAGFKEAGGIVLRDFWEFAPAGRAHLYPPFFPLLMLGLNFAGLPALFIMRLVSAAAFPALLASILFVITRLYGDRTAFFTVLAASLPYTFFLNVTVATPSAISLIILIFLFYAVESKRTAAGALLMGLMFYTHAGLSFITLLILAVYGLLRRDRLFRILLIALGGIILGGPWIIYLLRNRHYFTPANLQINNYFEASPALYALAAFGMAVAASVRRASLFYFAMLAGMACMLRDYSFRFFCGEGLLPFIFFAGLALENIYAALVRLAGSKGRISRYAVLIPLLMFYLLTAFSPGGSALSRFAQRGAGRQVAFESAIFMEKHMGEIFEAVKANTRPDEILYCNYNYVSGILYIFTGRAVSWGMLNEVGSGRITDPVSQSSLVVWIKNPDGFFEPELKMLIAKFGLKKAAETEISYIYRNPSAAARKTVCPPVIPARPALYIAAIWIGAICALLLRRF